MKLKCFKIKKKRDKLLLMIISQHYECKKIMHIFGGVILKLRKSYYTVLQLQDIRNIHTLKIYYYLIFCKKFSQRISLFILQNRVTL